MEISASCKQCCALKNAICFLVAKLRLVGALHHAEATMMRE